MALILAILEFVEKYDGKAVELPGGHSLTNSGAIFCKSKAHSGY